MNVAALSERFSSLESPFAYIERPMTNPTMLTSMLSAYASHVLLTEMLYKLRIGFDVIDSKKWQKKMGIKGDTKPASVRKGCELFPEHIDIIEKHKDADGILIAWAYAIEG